MMSFLWSRSLEGKKYQLASWSSISRPKCIGGWGLKTLTSFNEALILKKNGVVGSYIVNPGSKTQQQNPRILALSKSLVNR